MKIVEERLDQYMSTLDFDMSKVAELPTGVDAVEELKSLINALKPTYIILTFGNWTKQTTHWQEYINVQDVLSSLLNVVTVLSHLTD